MIHKNIEHIAHTENSTMVTSFYDNTTLKINLCKIIKSHESSVTKKTYESIYNARQIKQNSLRINLPSYNKKG